MDALERVKTGQWRDAVRCLLPVAIGAGLILWALFGGPPGWVRIIAAGFLPVVIEGAYRFGVAETKDRGK